MAEENQHIILPTSDSDEKKIIRREVERKRRTQMSTLCASLRSSVPFELIKGKRSVSDHIGEAASYVQFMKEKIDTLQIKRDRLKQVVDPASLPDETGGIEIPNHHSSAQDKCVNINPVPGGLEIDICSGLEECDSPPLSDLIEILLQQGCDVVSCVSTQVNGRTLHTVKCEVEDLTSLDLARLQQKLNHAILFRGDYSS